MNLSVCRSGFQQLALKPLWGYNQWGLLHTYTCTRMYGCVNVYIPTSSHLSTTDWVNGSGESLNNLFLTHHCSLYIKILDKKKSATAHKICPPHQYPDYIQKTIDWKKVSPYNSMWACHHVVYRADSSGRLSF